MLILVGLGNPGAKYARHRHNIGFRVVDEIVARRPGFGPEKARFQARVCEGRLGADKAVVVKPQTYMNESGRAVGEAMRFYKLSPADVVVIHDELDLAPGKVKVKQGGGHAGHNGLRSIAQHIGPDFVRVRLGIGHPGHKDRVSGYVLSDFAKAEEPTISGVVEAVEASAELLGARDWQRFSTEVARRLQAA
ncbi:peptidyl-tRNA hydrolase [Rhodothalassium salexigens DSM 2132]|uniref:Peptidyl-tRNA hydrolase n=1 Tax=Rhodothalassium salexigens DSM 2132 TaxID=1188247 RepID=A0A4R2PDJ8_RHOSA|nr:aminoacyl-tRNA hydrolase [Rhodothalassium salexigens]MBB4212321.1 PTH1 family peptidyl-tRNA hydrolase [Rhodothalassium salexigens DSM 2132]MBK1638821.1 aminoacyl-tRNA hydrolase [Rhodothalassium salexigens DSM 2132]TCP32528.1 peptidyl-tRNA hydrolase [Rhodothalassium salexigens DSM 2132]